MWKERRRREGQKRRERDCENNGWSTKTRGKLRKGEKRNKVF